MSKSFSRRAKQPASKTAQHQIPAPFTTAPASLEPFLQRLDPAQVHITHIDRLPREHKRQIFLIPVLLNGTIALLLAWRLWVALPKYWILLQTFLGYVTAATVDTQTTTRKEQIFIVLKRTLMIAGDYLLFRFIGVWPLTFFAEQPANPCSWRWTLGFQGEEVVVRVSRRWGAEDLIQGMKKGGESPFFKTRILPAIEPTFMHKTGYLMMDKSWDLEFELMLDAHTLLKQEQIRMEDLEKRVFVHQDGVGWLAWRWEEENDVVEGRRKKVVQFKEKLTAMGKESLFWRWMEIVEEERDVDGGFSAERQQKVAKRVQDEFQKNDVDFEEVVQSIGGLDEMPAAKS